MTKTLLRAGAMTCALLTSTAMCTQPAFAQETRGEQLLRTPADHFAISPGGVDMRSGRFVYSQTDLTVGGGDEGGGLALTRTTPNSLLDHINPFGNFSHNFAMMISERRLNIETGDAGFDYRMIVHMGGLANTFESLNVQSGFVPVSSGPWAKLTYPGVSSERSTAGIVYTYTAADGTIAVFRPMGSQDCSETQRRCAFVSHVIRPDGSRLDFDYAYNASAAGNRARLRRVTSSRGYALLLEGGQNLITKACALNLAHTALPTDGLCPAGAPVTASYTYSGANLTSAVDASGGSWGFTYPSGQMGFVKPGDTGPWLTNSLTLQAEDEFQSFEIVTQQQFATGESYTYAWEGAPYIDTTKPPPPAHGGSYTDAANATTIYRYGFPAVPGTRPGQPCYDPPCSEEPPIDENNPGPTRYQATPGPELIIDPLGRTTRIQYCREEGVDELPPHLASECFVEHVPIWFETPAGIRTYLRHDGSNNIIEARQIAVGEADTPANTNRIITSATFNTSNPVVAARPATMTDARGNVTDYVWDPVHGGLVSETAPAPTPGAPRPQTRHEYAQRHAWLSNGSGGYVQAATPIWLRTASSTCQTSAATGNPSAPCATSGDEVRTTYDYGPDSGPNNLNLRGQAVTAGGVTLRTCFTYDAAGRRIAETSPGAGLTQCQ